MFLSAHLFNSLRNKSLILSFYYDLSYSIFLRFAFEIFYRFLTVGTNCNFDENRPLNIKLAIPLYNYRQFNHPKNL